jgi:hypothetical protein
MNANLLRDVKRLFFGVLVREGFACPVEVGYQLHDGQRYRATYICFIRRSVFEIRDRDSSVFSSDVVLITEGGKHKIIKNRYTGKTFTFTTP